ncbi:MAG: shikimate dehydrogenase [Provencibacterium sp.]|jgi:shikimate dehydrogenase|nr:shikimate dehydrogenase [Provencibacterium sp.]
MYGLLGHPLGHSLSPQVHALLAETLGVPMDYRLFDTDPQQLEETVPRLLGLEGFNVTIPYKQKIIPYLSRLDRTAADYQSVNTVKPSPEGPVGYNTDCIGFLRSLETTENLGDVYIIGGAGGVGRMFSLEMARLGARVTLGVRPSSQAAAKALAGEIEARYGVPSRVVPVEADPDRSYRLLINASPCGMYPQIASCPVSEALIDACASVFDCIYNPAKTLLLQRAEALGKRTRGGMRMLVWQAAAAQEIWLGASFCEEQAERVEEQMIRLPR